MSGIVDVDCVASFVMRFAGFNCTRGYLHEGPHGVELRGQEYRVTRYGQAVKSDVTTWLEWPQQEGESYVFDKASLPRSHPFASESVKE